MRELSRLCRKLSRSLGLDFVVIKKFGVYSVYEVIHYDDGGSFSTVCLSNFRRVADVRRFLLDFFNF